MRSPDLPTLHEDERRALLALARASIEHGLKQGVPLLVVLDLQPPALQTPGAAFVTLQRHAQLRGCIGSLEAHRPLAQDVAENAYAAAFRDPRFPPLTAAEWGDIRVSISVLTPAVPIPCASEDELLAALQPGIDGLILAEDARRGTFLPAVWTQLPEPRDFLRQLKRKAGLSAEHWSPRMRAWRYRADGFGED